MFRKLLAIIILMPAVSCKHEPEHAQLIPGSQVYLDSLQGQSAYVTKDYAGNVVLSWVRMNDDSTFAFCYAVSKDGATFSAPVVIPNSGNIQPHGENLPKIIFKPSGEIIALWGVGNPNKHNKYSGLVNYVQSFDAGKTWSRPRSLVSDTASYDQRYYDVAILPGGEAGVVWLDNRKTLSTVGSGVYYSTTNGRNGFSDGKLVSEPACQCCRTVLFPDKEGNLHVLYRAIIQDSIRDMVTIMSSDAGKTFSAPRRISNDNWVINACPHTGPAMTENEDGLQYSWFTGGSNSGTYYASCAAPGGAIAHPERVTPTGSHPQMATLGKNLTTVVWDQYSSPGSAELKRIGVQVREGNDEWVPATYITNGEEACSFPVIYPLNERRFFVAYTAKKEGRSRVAYRVVEVREQAVLP